MIPKKGRTYVVYSPCELAICDHWSFLFCKIDPFVSVLSGTLFDRCPEGRADPAGGAPASGCSSTDPRSPRTRWLSATGTQAVPVRPQNWRPADPAAHGQAFVA